MDSRNLIDQSVSTDYCKLFGAPNCTQCLLTLIVTQFVEISFKCYQESGELVLGQPIQRELDDPSISSFLDSLNQFSSGLDVSDGLFASPVSPSSTYTLPPGSGGGAGAYYTPTLYNDATQYSTGYQGNLSGSVVVPSVGDIQISAPSQGEDLFNMLMVGQMQSLINPDPPAFAPPPPPPPQPPPQLLQFPSNGQLTSNGLSRDYIQNPDTQIATSSPTLPFFPPAPAPPIVASDTLDTSSLLNFLQNRGEAGPALNTNGLFQESVAVPAIVVAPTQEPDTTTNLIENGGDNQNGDSTISQNGERRGIQPSPVFDVPIVTSPPVVELINQQNGAVTSNLPLIQQASNLSQLQGLQQELQMYQAPIQEAEQPRTLAQGQSNLLKQPYQYQQYQYQQPQNYLNQQNDFVINSSISRSDQFLASVFSNFSRDQDFSFGSVNQRQLIQDEVFQKTSLALQESDQETQHVGNVAPQIEQEQGKGQELGWGELWGDQLEEFSNKIEKKIYMYVNLEPQVEKNFVEFVESQPQVETQQFLEEGYPYAQIFSPQTEQNFFQSSQFYLERDPYFEKFYQIVPQVEIENSFFPLLQSSNPYEPYFSTQQELAYPQTGQGQGQGQIVQGYPQVEQGQGLQDDLDMLEYAFGDTQGPSQEQNLHFVILPEKNIYKNKTLQSAGREEIGFAPISESNYFDIQNLDEQQMHAYWEDEDLEEAKIFSVDRLYQSQDYEVILPQVEDTDSDSLLYQQLYNIFDDAVQVELDVQSGEDFDNVFQPDLEQVEVDLEEQMQQNFSDPFEAPIFEIDDFEFSNYVDDVIFSSEFAPNFEIFNEEFLQLALDIDEFDSSNVNVIFQYKPPSPEFENEEQQIDDVIGNIYEFSPQVEFQNSNFDEFDFEDIIYEEDKFQFWDSVPEMEDFNFKFEKIVPQYEQHYFLEQNDDLTENIWIDQNSFVPDVEPVQFNQSTDSNDKIFDVIDLEELNDQYLILNDPPLLETNFESPSNQNSLLHSNTLHIISNYDEGIGDLEIIYDPYFHSLISPSIEVDLENFNDQYFEPQQEFDFSQFPILSTNTFEPELEQDELAQIDLYNEFENPNFENDFPPQIEINLEDSDLNELLVPSTEIQNFPQILQEMDPASIEYFQDDLDLSIINRAFNMDFFEPQIETDPHSIELFQNDLNLSINNREFSMDFSEPQFEMDPYSLEVFEDIPQQSNVVQYVQKRVYEFFEPEIEIETDLVDFSEQQNFKFEALFSPQSEDFSMSQSITQKSFYTFLSEDFIDLEELYFDLQPISEVQSPQQRSSNNLAIDDIDPHSIEYFENSKDNTYDSEVLFQQFIVPFVEFDNDFDEEQFIPSDENLFEFSRLFEIPLSEEMDPSLIEFFGQNLDVIENETQFKAPIVEYNFDINNYSNPNNFYFVVPFVEPEVFDLEDYYTSPQEIIPLFETHQQQYSHYTFLAPQTEFDSFDTDILDQIEIIVDLDGNSQYILPFKDNKFQVFENIDLEFGVPKPELQILEDFPIFSNYFFHQKFDTPLAELEEQSTADLEEFWDVDFGPEMEFSSNPREQYFGDINSEGQKFTEEEEEDDDNLSEFEIILVPSQDVEDLSQLFQWEVVSQNSQDALLEAPVPAPEEETDEDMEEPKIFHFPILMSSFVVPAEEYFLNNSLLQFNTGDKQLQQIDVAPSLEDDDDNNKDELNNELDCDLLGEGSDDCALQQITSQNIYFQPPLQDSIEDIIQLPSAYPQTQTRLLPSPLQEQNMEELTSPQNEISHDHSVPAIEDLITIPDASLEEPSVFLPAPESEFEADVIDPRLLQQILIQQQQQQQQQQQLQLQTREPEIEIDFLQDVVDDFALDVKYQNQLIAPAPEFESDENQDLSFNYMDLMLRENLDLRDFYAYIPEPESEIEIYYLDHADHDLKSPEFEFELILGDDLDLRDMYDQIPEPEIEIQMDEIQDLDHADHDLKSPEIEIELIQGKNQEADLDEFGEKFIPEPEPEFVFEFGNFDFPILTASLEDWDLESFQIIPEPEPEFKIPSLPILRYFVSLDLEDDFKNSVPAPEIEFPQIQNSDLDFEIQQEPSSLIPEPEPEFEADEEFDYDPEQIFETVISKQPFYMEIISKGFIANETLELVPEPEPEIEPEFIFPILQSINPFEFTNIAPEPEIEQKIYINGDRQFSAVDEKFQERIPGRDVGFSDENIGKQVFAPEPEPENLEAVVESAPTLLDFDLLASVKGNPSEPESVSSPSPPAGPGGLSQGFYTIWVPFLGAAVTCILIMVIVLFVLKARAAAAVAAAPAAAAAPAGEAAGAGRQAALLARAEVYGYNPPV